MGTNIQLRTLGDYVRHRANLLVECGACPHRGVLDAARLARWYHCHCWNPSIEVVGAHLYCRVCRGRPGFVRPIQAPADRPDWMRHEYEWGRLVRRLRNR